MLRSLTSHLSGPLLTYEPSHTGEREGDEPEVMKVEERRVELGEMWAEFVGVWRVILMLLSELSRQQMWL